MPLREAVTRGVERLIRPVTMTALAAILGLLPGGPLDPDGLAVAAPLAIVVVGGMIMTLVLANLVPVLYSFYGHREPPASWRRPTEAAGRRIAISSKSRRSLCRCKMKHYAPRTRGRASAGCRAFGPAKEGGRVFRSSFPPSGS